MSDPTPIPQPTSVSAVTSVPEPTSVPELVSIPEPGAALTDRTELLYRNARTPLVVDGHVSSTVFEPSRTDNKLLSVDRSSKSRPKIAFELFLSRAGSTSSGILAVTAEECQSEGVPALENELADNPAHTVCDFRSHNNSQTKKRAAKLRDLAMTRGWLHP